MNVQKFLNVYLGFRDYEKGILVRSLNLQSEHFSIALIQVLVWHTLKQAVIQLFGVSLNLNNFVERARSGKLCI
jgi:hypothetical protein